MTALRVASLIVYTCGMFACGAMFALWARGLARVRWRAHRDAPATRPREAHVMGGVLLCASAVWFAANLLAVLLSFGPRVELWSLELVLVWLAFLYPPLIMHVTWLEVHRARPGQVAAGWRAMLWPVYLAMALGAAWVTAASRPGSGIDQATLARVINAGLGSAFVLCALYCVALLTRFPVRGREPRARQSHRWIVTLFALMVPLFIVTFVLDDGAASGARVAAALELVAKSLPLAFMFVGAYFGNRFEFFDRFVKRGAALLVSIAALTAWLALTLPWLGRLNPSSVAAAPWIFTIVLLPVVMLLPWTYSRLATILDRRWLGRQFTAVEAMKRFVSGLRSATTELQLTAMAETELQQIFGAPAAVRIGVDTAPAPFPVVHEAAIRAGGTTSGWFLMGRRTSEAPYFSEDTTLLASLADVFGSVLENMTLQRRDQEQERRARELSLHASRSELKALRAQINPHFLFNALNAIAGLIHRNPAAADQTIEKLAEVFRYALRAESEWALLDDELEFVQAYLDVEQARFGTRLAVEVRVAVDARGARVPTMIVQTLVENAVKHGAAEVIGHASVRVNARRDDDRLVVAVTDNGPGFSESTLRPRRGGYGLSNIRQRLEGYFGDRAALTIARDEAAAVTRVEVSLPFLTSDVPGGHAATAPGIHR